MDLITILIIIGLTLLCGLGIYLIAKFIGLKPAAYKLICMAEAAYKKGQNTEKFEAVFIELYSKLPSFAKVFITEKMVKTLIQKVFDKIKLALDTTAKKR